jgi:hypothetical protein
MPLRLTNATLMLDIQTEWTLSASLTRFSSFRKCSKRRILGHSAQATSLLPIEGTTKCSLIVLGFGCGNDMDFAAEVKPKAGLGFKASIVFPILNRIGYEKRDHERSANVVASDHTSLEIPRIVRLQPIVRSPLGYEFSRIGGSG